MAAAVDAMSRSARRVRLDRPAAFGAANTRPSFRPPPSRKAEHPMSTQPAAAGPGAAPFLARHSRREVRERARQRSPRQLQIRREARRDRPSHGPRLRTCPANLLSAQPSMDWSTTVSRSARSRPASIRGARRPASAIAARGTNLPGEMGRSSATGTPLRVMTIVCPAWTSRKTAPESLRSSRWEMILLTVGSVALVTLGSKLRGSGRPRWARQETA